MRFNLQLINSGKQFSVLSMGIVERDGKILLVQEASKRFYGRWALPMTECAVNESLHIAAERAVKEITNLRARVSKIVTIQHHYDESAVTGQLLVVYTMKNVRGELTAVAGKTLNAEWFSYNQIFRMPDESLHFPHIRLAIKQYRKGHYFPLDIIHTT